ncbi:MAG: hypothetical protein K8I82_24500 [Anaerolineae bacterium]|nr:hypothetical protein [Anaerolineae bacterium]
MGCLRLILPLLIFLGLGLWTIPETAQPEVMPITAVPEVTEHQMTATTIIQNATGTAAAATPVPTLPPTWTPTSTLTP